MLTAIPALIWGTPFVRLFEEGGAIFVYVDDIKHSLIGLLIKYRLWALGYAAYVCAVAWALSAAIRKLASKYKSIGRLLYGPLAPLMRSDDEVVLTSFILTKIVYNSKRLIYAGFPLEVGLKEGSKIDYVVLDDPIKFYLKLDGAEPQSTYNKQRQLSPAANAVGIFYVSGEEIENVHFEGWYF